MILKKGFILALLLALPIFIHAQELKPIKLPAPKTEGGKPLMQALKERKSIEKLKNKEIADNLDCIFNFML